MGMRRPDLRPELLLFILWRRIIVAYELPEGRVDIIRIFSAGQDYEAFLAGD